MKVISRTLCLALAGLVLLPLSAEARSKAARPKVEVVFVLDTTGSMGGLIQSAKQKIWSIVNEIAKGQPSPEIKLGLVGYRDKGDAYVTTRTDLTTDLDAVYEKLMALGADGGGDGPEHVNQALWEAVHEMSWSDSKKTLKVIFLVGDAPPHMDYQDDVDYMRTCRKAVRKNIIVNTIQCGGWDETAKTWKDIAYRSEGRYVAIAQTGGTVAVATPFDAELSTLSSKLDSTYITYGRVAEQRKAKARVKKAAVLAEAAAPEASAARSSFRGSAGASLGSRDFLGALDKGEVDLDRMKEDSLPEELKGKSKAEQKKFVAAKKSERAALQRQIAEVSKKRDAYIKSELEKTGGAKDGFDSEVMASIKERASDVGIAY